MFHIFDTEIATMYGINAAVIFQNIAFWCDHSRANNANFYDGHYWTFNSVRAFQDQFPYLGKKQIDNAIRKLVDEGLIVKGNYNKVAYDRTTWYSLTENGEMLFHKKGNPLLQNGTIDLPKKGNGNSQKGKPIPDINPDVKEDKSISSAFDDFWSVYPRKASKATASKAWTKLKPDDALCETIIADVKRRIDGEWAGKDIQYIPHPTTYINQRRWEDEQSVEPEKPHGTRWQDLDIEERLRLQDEQAAKDREALFGKG